MKKYIMYISIFILSMIANIVSVEAKDQLLETCKYVYAPGSLAGNSNITIEILIYDNNEPNEIIVRGNLLANGKEKYETYLMKNYKFTHVSTCPSIATYAAKFDAHGNWTKQHGVFVGETEAEIEKEISKRYELRVSKIYYAKLSKNYSEEELKKIDEKFIGYAEELKQLLNSCSSTEDECFSTIKRKQAEYNSEYEVVSKYGYVKSNKGAIELININKKIEQFANTGKNPIIPPGDYPITGNQSGCAILSPAIKEKLNWVLNIIKYGGAILAIILGMLDFVKAIFGDKEEAGKEAAKKFIKRLIAAALLFLLPLILQFFINVVEIPGINKDDPYCER